MKQRTNKLPTLTGVDDLSDNTWITTVEDICDHYNEYLEERLEKRLEKKREDSRKQKEMDIIPLSSTGTPAKSDDLIEINDDDDYGIVTKVPKRSSSSTPPSSVSHTMSLAGDFDTNIKQMNSIHDEASKKRIQLQEERLQLDRERMEEEKRKTDLLMESLS